MRFLFDENLSPDLVRLLSDLFPESVHVRDVGLKSADDPVVWQYERKSSTHCLEGLGSPSEQLRLWASTEAHRGTSRQLFDIGRERLLRRNFDAITIFEEDSEAAFPALS